MIQEAHFIMMMIIKAIANMKMATTKDKVINKEYLSTDQISSFDYS